ncbi:hypothetical protein [Siccirubricoccus sp. G192]|uniref:hypothetical protein n=1 Tax=Siccirubricoccus sp. G192 TaxID=2849651 RepID=UPI0020C55549|nr:hypothetical protein [Siccirubricoccus sp. G192]
MEREFQAAEAAAAATHPLMREEGRAAIRLHAERNEGEDRQAQQQQRQRAADIEAAFQGRAQGVPEGGRAGHRAGETRIAPQQDRLRAQAPHAPTGRLGPNSLAGFHAKHERPL